MANMDNQGRETFWLGLLTEDNSETNHTSMYYFQSHQFDRIPKAVSDAGSQEMDVAEQASKYLIYVIGVTIGRFWPAIIVPLGFVGNTLAFLVMLQKHNQQISCCVYMCGLSVADNAMLGMCVQSWLHSMEVVPHWINWECKVIICAFRGFSLCSTFIIVAITIDRFLAICYPLHAANWCTHRRAKLTLYSLYLFSLLYSFSFIFFSGVIGGTTCATFPEAKGLTLVYSVFVTLINSLVPFSIIITLNVIMVRALKNRKKNLQLGNKSKPSLSDIKSKTANSKNADYSHSEMGGSFNRMSTKEQQLCLMLLAVSFVFLALTIPLYIRYTVFLIIDYRSDPSLYSIYTLAWHISNRLFYTNNAVNFYLYCIGGSKFREDTKALFCHKKFTYD